MHDFFNISTKGQHKIRTYKIRTYESDLMNQNLWIDDLRQNLFLEVKKPEIKETKGTFIIPKLKSSYWGPFSGPKTQDLIKRSRILTGVIFCPRSFGLFCGRHVMWRAICYVPNWRILEYSRNLFPFFFKTSKTETANQCRDSWFQISNFEIHQVAFLMTCRPH